MQHLKLVQLMTIAALSTASAFALAETRPVQNQDMEQAQTRAHSEHRWQSGQLDNGQPRHRYRWQGENGNSHRWQHMGGSARSGSGKAWGGKR